MRLPKPVKQALEETGLPWTVERGSNHRKIKVSGKLVGILPNAANRSTSPDRAQKNIVAQIRRAGRST